MVLLLNISCDVGGLRAKIAARKAKMEGFEQMVQQARQIGVKSIQDNLYPGHGFDTGNMSKSFERCSTAVVPEPFKAEITWTSDVSYQPAQEVKSPHLVVGIVQAWPQIQELAKNWGEQ